VCVSVVREVGKVGRGRCRETRGDGEEVRGGEWRWEGEGEVKQSKER